ncbi:PilW family protein [Pleionea sp. CnH1-48]|uniref:PilW family protein n=1 Tax=Pleionea sp. CnH1-48 TaxID=2954494 RepID=UPI0020974068|nr:PilW family protein [Pleionea sp. CnH1-48]MCO7222871.1 PilW family protein [Pleionea sp. CnH1-48]
MIRYSIKKSSGFSLLELLIASVLGLILLAGVISLFLGSRTTFTMQEQMANVQTDGRFALMFLERHIENAGWIEGDFGGTIYAVDFDAAKTTDGGSGGNDSITVSMEVPTGTQDCTGSTVTTSVMTNRFYLGGTDNTTLLCEGNGGGTAQPIVENVESFQLLYGVDTDANGVANHYLDATTVRNNGSALKVVSVQVALLIMSEDKTLQQKVSKTYDVLDQEVTRDDLRLRRVFRQTIFMPNQAYSLIPKQS